MTITTCTPGAGEFTSPPLSTSTPPFPNVKRNPQLQLYNQECYMVALDAAIPTNAWWQNLILENGENTVKTYPYLFRMNKAAISCSYPSRYCTEKALFEIFDEDLQFSATELLSSSSCNRRVEKFDDLSVTVVFKNKSNSEAGVTTSESLLRVPLVKGQAYISFLLENITPVLSSRFCIESVNGVSVVCGGGTHKPPPMVVSGTKLKIKLNNGKLWILYASEAVSFQVERNQMKSLKQVRSGYVRLAYVNQECSALCERILDKHHKAIPIGGNVHYSSRQKNRGSEEDEVKSASVTFSFTKNGSSSDKLLMLALPHHVDVMKSDNTCTVLPHVWYQNLKGRMRAVVADAWKMSIPLSSTSWFSKTKIPSSTMQELKIRESLLQDASSLNSAPQFWKSTYFFGKELARMARLALIADELSEKKIAQDIRSWLRKYIEPWIDGTQLVYDSTMGGLVFKEGLNDKGVDFGSAWYNDHHFQFGYYLYTAAVITKEDPEWCSKHKEALLCICRDIVNPNSIKDTHFPKFRCFDWYLGHSWASGLYSFVDGRNQESTSEAVNAYYAVKLFGAATNNEQLLEIGDVLLGIEIQSSQKYWQIKDDSIYPEQAINQHRCVGIMWDTKIDYSTWFGDRVEFIHCIQMLPFNPVSEDLLAREWLEQEIPILRKVLPKNNNAENKLGGWEGFILLAMSIVNPSASIIDRLWSMHEFDNGTTRTDSLYFVASQIARYSHENPNLC